MEPGSSMPNLQGLSSNPYPEPYQSSSEALCDVSEQIYFYSVRLLASRQSLKLDGHSWSAIHNSLFNIFVVNLHIWRPTALQPQSAGKRHDVVTVT